MKSPMSKLQKSAVRERCLVWGFCHNCSGVPLWLRGAPRKQWDCHTSPSHTPMTRWGSRMLGRSLPPALDPKKQRSLLLTSRDDTTFYCTQLAPAAKLSNHPCFSISSREDTMAHKATVNLFQINFGTRTSGVGGDIFLQWEGANCSMWFFNPNLNPNTTA